VKRSAAKNFGPGQGCVLFDVDNTLLDNDRVTDDLQKHLQREVGETTSAHLLENVRAVAR